MNTDVVKHEILTNKADAWCECVSDFGPVPTCTNCNGTGRDPAKWLAWKLENCRRGSTEPQEAKRD